MSPSSPSIFRSSVPSAGIGQSVDAMVNMASFQRRQFERRWYDNNFFDDGFHFRYLNRQTNKIVDLSDRPTANAPQRAIPKASRQIRGVSNLLMAPEYIPVIYPYNVYKHAFTNPEEYKQAVEVSKSVAKKQGQYVTEEFKKQEIQEKLIQMLILTCKHGISFLEMWPDAVEEKIKSEVFDAFDIYVMGNLTSIYESPFLIKAVPALISVIKANENFSPEALAQISPDNKYASSEIKQAYMQSRFGVGPGTDQTATLIQKEAFIKEYISEDNIEMIRKFSSDPSVLEGKNNGDMVMRHVFTAGGVTLKDEYVDLKEYPFVDLRLEPGPLYQVPLIERFIPANKSLDILASRVEGFANTMMTGTWLTRKGDDFEITNIPGGQKLSYTTSPPVQAQMSSVPSYMFNFMGFLEKLIEEQGASTSSTNALPDGVKSGVAIESIKSTEYANLKIPSMMLKRTVKKIAEKIIDITSNFVDPQMVYLLHKGEPQYFEVIGERGIEKRKELGLNINPEMVPVKRDCVVDIEVESGLGFTMEGKKSTMQQVVGFMVELSGQGLLTQDAVKVVVEKLLEVYQFGSTQEFMDAMDSGTQSSPLTEEQLSAMKVAVLEVLKDAGVIGEEADQKLIDSTKIGTVEALKDTGMLEKQQKQEEPPKEPSQSISFKDLPPEGQAQLAQKAGIYIDPTQMREEQQEVA